MVNFVNFKGFEVLGLNFFVEINVFGFVFILMLG